MLPRTTRSMAGPVRAGQAAGQVAGQAAGSDRPGEIADMVVLKKPHPDARKGFASVRLDGSGSTVDMWMMLTGPGSRERRVHRNSIPVYRIDADNRTIEEVKYKSMILYGDIK